MVDEALLVRELFNYCAYTGALTWAQNRGKARVGAPVGATDKNGYIRVRFNKRFHSAHRLCWLHFYGKWPSAVIDHINGDPSDNRLCNLREATVAQNQWNLRKKPIGVFWHKTNKKWTVSIKANGKLHHFGSFNSIEDASVVAIKARKELHGEFTSI